MNETDAHNALTATARLRILPEPFEGTQLMTFAERQHRRREARELRQVWQNVEWVERELQKAHADLFDVPLTNGAALLVALERLPDFRDGQREYRLLPHEIAQQDGFPND